MPSSTFWGLQHLNASVMCSIVVDKYGSEALSCPAEICILPLDHMLDPHPELLLFNMRVKPDSLESIDWKVTRHTRPEVGELMMSGFDKYKVADLMYQWFKEMQLRDRKKIIPLGFRFHEVCATLREMVGESDYAEMFDTNYRDVGIAANWMNDQMACRGIEVPFAKQDLRWICKKLNIPPIEKGGSASLDALQIAQAYKRLLMSQ